MNSRNNRRKTIIRDKSRCWLEPRQYFEQAAWKRVFRVDSI